ncbi:MAG: hypothetical protein P8Y60_17005, partial [Calditrichota bacterium]
AKSTKEYMVSAEEKEIEFFCQLPTGNCFPLSFSFLVPRLRTSSTVFTMSSYTFIPFCTFYDFIFSIRDNLCIFPNQLRQPVLIRGLFLGKGRVLYP